MNRCWHLTDPGVPFRISVSHQQRMLQQSRNVSISAKLKCHLAASLGAGAGAAETTISERRRLTRRAFEFNLAASAIAERGSLASPASGSIVAVHPELG